MNPTRLLFASLPFLLLSSLAFSAPPKAVIVAPPAPPKPAPEFATWINLCSLRPASAIQAQLLSLPVEPGASFWHVLKIEDGKGPLLLDQSSLVITKMPMQDGKPLEANALLSYVRKHFAELVQGSQSIFSLHGDSDKALWDSESPTGALATLETAGSKSALVVSEAAADHFTFSSVEASSTTSTQSPLIWQRSISVQEATPFEGCIFATHAVARATGDKVPPASPVWGGLLTAVADFVQKNGGAVEATMLPSVTTIASWETVQPKFHQPKVAWLDLNGSWQSTDPSKRFRLEISGWTGKCEFIERNARGQELKMTLPIKVEMEKPGELKYIISRPNNTKEILEYYGFPDAVRGEILSRVPEPSILTLTPTKGGKLNGLWSGISITKDPSGKHLKEMKQPSEAKPKPYTFAPPKATPETPAPTVLKAQPTAPGL